MIFNAMIEAMLVMKLLMGILIDLAKIIIGGIRVIVETGIALFSNSKSS